MLQKYHGSATAYAPRPTGFPICDKSGQEVSWGPSDSRDPSKDVVHVCFVGSLLRYIHIPYSLSTYFGESCNSSKISQHNHLDLCRHVSNSVVWSSSGGHSANDLTIILIRFQKQDHSFNFRDFKPCAKHTSTHTNNTMPIMASH